jgi:hypothetical protein
MNNKRKKERKNNLKTKKQKKGIKNWTLGPQVTKCFMDDDLTWHEMTRKQAMLTSCHGGFEERKDCGKYLLRSNTCCAVQDLTKFSSFKTWKDFLVTPLIPVSRQIGTR